MVKKKEKKNKLIVWLTNRYELIVRNEADFAERRTLTFTYAQVLFSLLSVFALMMGGSLLLSKTLLSEWFNPEYEFNKLKYEISGLAEQTDSLEHALVMKDHYIMSFKKRLDPEYKEDIQSDVAEIPSSEGVKHEADPVLNETEGLPLDVVKPEVLNIASELLVFPVDNYKTVHKDTATDGGQALLFEVAKDENVKAIKEGTVSVCTWDKDMGSVMIINHKEGLQTVYNGLGVLFKAVGDYVLAGDVVAFSGKNYAGTESVVKFEMWHNSIPINPENYYIIKK